MKHFNIFLCLLAMLLASCSSDNDKQQVRHKGTPIRIGVTTTLDCLPFFVAQEIALDEQMGIHLLLNISGSKADLDSAFVNGSVCAILTDNTRAERIKANWLRLNTKKHESKDSVDIYPHDNLQLYLFTNSKSRIREGKQLLDKVIGVDRQGTDAVMARMLLDSVKLSDDKSFLVQMQSYDIRQHMLMINTIDAAVIPEPYASQARKAGHHALISGNTVNGKKAGVLVARGNSQKLRELYNRACDSINHNGIHAYDSVIGKHFTIPQSVISAIPAHKFKKL